MANLLVSASLSKAAQTILSLWFTLFVLTSHASTVSPVGDNTVFRAGSGDINDILVTDTKNSNDTSFNRLTDFRVDRPLTIYNGARTSDATTYADAAKIIVISASNISLNSKIEIVGPPADILFISTGSIPLSCSNCSFTNAGRVTLAHGSYDNTYNVGNISSRASGGVSIHNLSAPGILSLEVIAETINVTGTLDINLRADIHPEGGMVVHEQGAKIVGSGGVNLYPGRFSIRYQDLLLNSMSAYGGLNFSGHINAASIAITSPKNINIPNGSKLNTLSDALSSSTRNGEFYAPLEGIFLSTLKSTSANINISGILTTDNSISLKSHNDISLNSSSQVIAKSTELIANNVVSTQGLVQTTNFDVAPAHYRNTGNISAQTILVSASTAISNGYGGIMKAKKVTLSSPAGTIINGSRSNKINYGDVNNFTLDVDLTASVWGVKSHVSSSGTSASKLSAHILANEIYIDSHKFENINPYAIQRPNLTAWDQGISVNNSASNRVSIQAENVLKIKAAHYALNSSAILGLNQEGDFHLNTPKFSNERYHMAADIFKYTQLLLSDDKARQHDSIDTGDITRITWYAPPGRLYSFGEFKFNHIAENTKAEFINEFSYFEVFKDLYFYKANVKTLGLETSQLPTGAEIQQIRACLTFQHCPSTTIMTNAEAETLFSVRGNIYGINPNNPSQSDLTIDNINVYDAQVKTLADAYLAQFYVNDYNDLFYSYVVKSSIDNSVLTALVEECRKIYIQVDKHLELVCDTKTITKDFTEELTDQASNNEYKDTGYTYNQISAAIMNYIAQLSVDGFYDQVSAHSNNLVNFDYDPATKRLTINYSQSVTYFDETAPKPGNKPGIGAIVTQTKGITIHPLFSILVPYIK